MRRNRAPLLQASALACVLVTASNAETVTYTYDALGRLVRTSTAGGQNNGNSTAFCYDAASNRERVVTALSGPAVCTPAPYPTPTPTPAPSP